MNLALRRLRVRALAAAGLVVALAVPSVAAVSKPYKILTRTRNPIVRQYFGAWLMITEDLPTGRVCYYYNPSHRSKLTLTTPIRGEWVPLGSAIKWLMYVDSVDGLTRLMAHNVDYHLSHAVFPSQQNQVGCGFVGTDCIFGEYRASRVGDHYPVDLYRVNLATGARSELCVSDSEKSQFSHDGRLLVYRAYLSAGDVRIMGCYFSGGAEFEIAARNGFFPSVFGNLVTWAEPKGPGWDIVAIDISTGELRTVAFTKANPPRPQAGRGGVFWQDARTVSTTGLDIYGYDWKTRKELAVSKARGDESRLRVCGDLITWVTGPANYQTLWGAKIKP